MQQTRPFPSPMAHPDTLPISIPMPTSGTPVQYAFITLEGLVGHFAQCLPSHYVNAIIENEKEIFVVRKECSLHETRLQFLKKCENRLLRTLSDLQNGRTSLDWSYGNPAGH